MEERELKKFYKKVNKYMECPKKIRTKNLNYFKTYVKDFLHDHPAISTEDFIKKFGTPQDVAESYLEDIPSDVLRKYHQTKLLTIVFSIIGFFAIIILACSIIFREPETKTVLEPIEIPTTEVSQK